MSLFQVREWWRASCGTGEEFDKGCMCVGNVDNDASGETKVITGSFQGLLRVLHPHHAAYSADHLLLEMDLKLPILQLAVGRYTTEPGLSLAILHPRCIVIYRVVAQGGVFQLDKCYEHPLEHTAANFISGPFGGQVGVDLLCVQSMDGELCFFEREAVLFTRYLPTFLVPGPLCYVLQMDSFITCNAALEVECYKYATLSAAGVGKTTGGGLGGLQVGQAVQPPGSRAANDTAAVAAAAKKAQPAWKFVLGEGAMDIKPARLSPETPLTQMDICILGERTLFVLSETGLPLYSRRLDFIPTAMCPYFLDHAANRQNLLLTSSTGQLLVLDVNKPAVLWSAKGDITPIQVLVAKFGALPGVVASLDEHGHVVLSFMGTTPSAKVIQVHENACDYEALETEHRSLLNKIREATSQQKQHGPSSNNTTINNNSFVDAIVLKTQVPLVLDTIPVPELDTMQAGRSVASSKHRTLTITLLLQYTGRGAVHDVLVTVETPPPVRCRQPRTTIPRLASGGVVSGGAYALELVFDGKDRLPCAPLSSRVVIHVTYQSESNQPRTASTDFHLPASLLCRPVPPIKEAQYKITIDTNRPPPRIASLYDDVLAGSDVAAPGATMTPAAAVAAANVLTFLYPDESHATIIVSKNAGRYRIQASSYAGLYFLVQDIIQRLQSYFSSSSSGGNEGPFIMSLMEPVPLGDLFEVIDDHFTKRKAMKDVEKQLEASAALYRSVEKRLLVRFKDKAPQPLNKLEDLLRAAHVDVNKRGEELTAALDALACADRALAASIEATIILAKVAYNLSDKTVEALKGYLSPMVSDAQGAEPGWEELTEAAMTQLVRTALSKQGAELGNVGLIQVVDIQDTTRLKKVIATAFDRLSKGASLDK